MFKVIGPSNNFIVNDIYIRTIKYLKFDNEKTNSLIIKRIIKKNLPKKTKIFNGSWENYKKFQFNQKLINTIINNIIRAFKRNNVNYDIVIE